MCVAKGMKWTCSILREMQTENISYKKLELMSCALPSKSIMLENYQAFLLMKNCRTKLLEFDETF